MGVFTPNVFDDITTKYQNQKSDLSKIPPPYRPRQHHVLSKLSLFFFSFFFCRKHIKMHNSDREQNVPLQVLRDSQTS